MTKLQTRPPSFPALLLLASLFTLWGCAATDPPAKLSPAPVSQSQPPVQEEPATPEIDVTLAEEMTIPEPEMTMAEEIEELESLGSWEEGTPEKVPAKEEITYDFPVTMNKQVEFYLNFFQHKHKNTFSRWLARSGRYLPMMKEKLRAAGLPEDLAYLPMIESGYSLTAYSRAKAAGPWQFIPSTARHYGLKINSYVDERRNPVKATDAAISFLSDLHDQFGDWQLAVAGYNAGARKISRGLKRYKTKNFWDLAQKRYLKNETKRYVPKLIAAIIIAKNPEEYGFDTIDYQTALDYETVEVPRWTSLRAVSVAADLDLDDLHDLNRELRQLITPPDAENYPLKVPPGQKAVVAENLPHVLTTVTTNYKTHVVTADDTLSRICQKYNLNKTTLLKANNLRKSKLTPGQRLRIPYQTTNYVLWKQDTPYAGNDGESQMVLHQVKSGETVSAIARRYNVPARLIAAWNGLKSIHRIKAGQQLALYVTDSAGGENVVTAEAHPQARSTTATRQSFYRVSSGDSLWTISRRFDLTTDQLKRWNNLKSNLIHPGTRLRLHAPDAEKGAEDPLS